MADHMGRKKKIKKQEYIIIPVRKRIILCISGILFFCTGYFVPAWKSHPAVSEAAGIALILTGGILFLLGVIGRLISGERSLSEAAADSAVTVLLNRIIDLLS